MFNRHPPEGRQAQAQPAPVSGLWQAGSVLRTASAEAELNFSRAPYGADPSTLTPLPQGERGDSRAGLDDLDPGRLRSFDHVGRAAPAGKRDDELGEGQGNHQLIAHG